MYPYSGHEGGQIHQWLRQTEWLPARLSWRLLLDRYDQVSVDGGKLHMNDTIHLTEL